MLQNNESIYSLLPPEPIQYHKSPIYRSKYPGVLPPTGSTLCTKNTTIPGINNCGGYLVNSAINHSPTAKDGSFGKGVLVRNSLDPKHFMKKGEGQVCSQAKLNRLQLNKNQSEVFNNKYTKPLSVLASNSILTPINNNRYKNKEPVPKHTERPILGLKTNKNYILENSITNILSTPPIRNEKIEYTKKPNYGQVPSYLIKRQEELEREAKVVKTFFEQEAERDNKIKQVPDEEIRELKQRLKQKWDEVNRKYQKYTYLNQLDSLVKIRNKTGLEKQLIQLEKDMERLNKKYIFLDQAQ